MLASPFAAAAQSFCASDGQPAPSAIVERFISADCESCWATAGAKPAANAMVLDWIVPGSRGDDAPLSAAATRDSLARLAALHQPPPGTAANTLTNTPVRRIGGASRLRVAHGLPLAGYVGASIELKPVPARAEAAPWTAWLVLVETIAAGSEGTPVTRNLVRNVLVQDWNPAQAAPAAETPAGTRSVPRLFESRPMGVAEGARPERLRVLGWVQDAQGRVFGAAQSKCIAPKE
ncbi:hypothetical protein RD110_20120 [Rhodoferax koreense]|uniref:DUF1223 domain-containing protein n=2 Tax=Rhodoferax koreensis TaxID=1842727 RepID=A0A1P8JZS0_9BURK|nr:hypothetical protein RD110_20120 [Rhodoferax koreense]